MADGSEEAAREGEAVLARAVSAYRAALGSRLIAAYALGSLAHGGFSSLVSGPEVRRWTSGWPPASSGGRGVSLPERRSGARPTRAGV